MKIRPEKLEDLKTAIGKDESTLADVLVWLKANAGIVISIRTDGYFYTYTPFFDNKFCLNEKSWWDLSRLYLKDQPDETVTWLHNFIKE